MERNENEIRDNGGGGYTFDAPPLPVPSREELLAAGINIAVGIPMERTLTSTSGRLLGAAGRSLITSTAGRTSTATAWRSGYGITRSTPTC